MSSCVCASGSRRGTLEPQTVAQAARVRAMRLTGSVSRPVAAHEEDVRVHVRLVRPRSETGVSRADQPDHQRVIEDMVELAAPARAAVGLTRAILIDTIASRCEMARSPITDLCRDAVSPWTVTRRSWECGSATGGEGRQVLGEHAHRAAATVACMTPSSCCCDGLKGLPDAIAQRTWPLTEVQLVYQCTWCARDSRLPSKRYWGALCRDAAPIDTRPTRGAATACAEFAEQWRASLLRPWSRHVGATPGTDVRRRSWLDTSRCELRATSRAAQPYRRSAPIHKP